ncbi:hypothetical protein B0H67DRAFT_569137 [Lasiosphaeris hirsuta]|uniref:AMP-dependent synthetase/ligase domain-containing protein n=1 Tax=Lasiosphaeris hirsuta TaxID=260670 RepID=A0AA40AZL0_9PEZI|nr:hypothetical protein B0H67DRAFT_569137 [Lasiosphaeris hirsuta]
MPSLTSQRLPDEPIFKKLIENGKSNPNVIFQDASCGVDATYPQLLYDIVSLRQRLYEWLPPSLFDDDGRIKEENPYILIVAPANYEFVVASLAVLAIGAALVPLAPAILPEEALYFSQRCKSKLMLVSSPCLPLASEIEKYAQANGDKLNIQPIASGLRCWDGEAASLGCSLLSSGDFCIDERMTVAASRPSLILFTSGTTGPPKGVVHTRSFFYFGYGTSNADVFLTHRPVHWIGGLRSTINLVANGTRQEVVTSSAPAIWERIRQGGVTMLCCVIPMWWSLMRHYHDVISPLPENERDAYLQGMRALRVARIGGAMPLPSLLQFWREEIGIPLELTYGCTETGGPGFMTDSQSDRSVERCLGQAEDGVVARFSEGDFGEIFLKTRFLFSHYLDDIEATKAAFTSDGFFKTGDYVSRLGKEYVFEGRTSTDFVRFHGFKIPVLEVETQLAQLPSVAEACVVSIPDKDASTRVGAIVRLKEGFEHENLVSIRNALADKLLYYKLPTALRVLGNGEQIPSIWSGKVARRKVSELFFPVSESGSLPAEIQSWDIKDKELNGGPKKAWDWAGLQGC